MYLVLFFKKEIKIEVLKKIVIGTKESDWQFLSSDIAVIETSFNDHDVKGIKERVQKSCSIVDFKFMDNRNFRIFETEVLNKKEQVQVC